MKKIAFVLVALMVSVAANAQFEQGQKYISTSLSGLNLSYSGSEKGHLALQAKGGYFFMDHLLATAQLGYETQDEIPDFLTLGVGGRYYIIQNGVYLGAGVNYKHSSSYNDFMPTVQVGYAFFVNGCITIEPEIYYEQSFKNHKDFSKVGLRLGLGFYF